MPSSAGTKCELRRKLCKSLLQFSNAPRASRMRALNCLVRKPNRAHSLAKPGLVRPLAIMQNRREGDRT